MISIFFIVTLIGLPLLCYGYGAHTYAYKPSYAGIDMNGMYTGAFGMGGALLDGGENIFINAGKGFDAKAKFGPEVVISDTYGGGDVGILGSYGYGLGYPHSYGGMFNPFGVWGYGLRNRLYGAGHYGLSGLYHPSGPSGLYGMGVLPYYSRLSAYRLARTGAEANLAASYAGAYNVVPGAVGGENIFIDTK